MEDDIWLRRQRALAHFGEKALAEDDVGALLEEACRLVAEGLDSPIAKVLKQLSDQTDLLLCATVGLPRALAVPGVTTIPGGDNSAAGHAIKTAEPVVSRVPTETRFEAGDVVRKAGVIWSINVLIRCPDGPYGALEADRTDERPFEPDDIDFLTTYANLLGAAIQRRRNGERIQALLQSQSLLFRELQHRVKNDLQVITSIISLQINQPIGGEAKRQLEGVRDRIDSLRIVHERLFSGTTAGQIDLAEYLRALSAGRFQMHGLDPRGAIRLETPRKPLNVDHDRAIAVGLIVNEFLTNSLKHAFPGGAGAVRIATEKRPDGRARLSLSDTGSRKETTPDKSGAGTGPGSGIGLKLIDLLARQIDAEVAWSRDEGTRLELTFRPGAAFAG